jgi:hypothetical protein
MVFEKDGYALVNNILNDELCKVASNYALFQRSTNFSSDVQVPGVHSMYSDPLMESILLLLQPKIEEYTNKKLIPVCSYYRVYSDGSILKDHTDRPACEISVSITLGYNYTDNKGDYIWPLHVYLNGEKRCFRCDVGDALIFKGAQLVHGRDLLNAGNDSYHIQLFLHYVDSDGSYTEYKFDNRNCIGINS